MTASEGARAVPATVNQTVGPFFGIGLSWLYRSEIADPSGVGQLITVRGRVLDGDGEPVPDAFLELWQADSNGKYAHPEDLQDKIPTLGFKGYGRVPTTETGQFQFTTVKPGRVPAPNGGMQAPHILVAVFMRGLLRHLATRIYFADEPSNGEDFVLNHVPEERRNTLIARPSAEHPSLFEWNIALQGADETVFFDL